MKTNNLFQKITDTKGPFHTKMGIRKDRNGRDLTEAGASLMTQLVMDPPAMQKTWVQSLGWEDPLEKGKANPLQYSGLENFMNCIVHGVAKSRTRLSNFHLYETPPPLSL